MQRTQRSSVLLGSFLALSGLLLSGCGTDASTPLAQTTPAQPASVNESASSTPVTTLPLPPDNELGYKASGYAFPDCYAPEKLNGSTVADHRCSWAYNALELQTLISRSQPLTASSFLATHNAFNSSAYIGLSSSGDPNQSLSMNDQLQLGMQGLELDIHWIPHAASGAFAPVVCHGVGASMGHLGCSPTDPLLKDVLKEIRAALDKPENKHLVLMLDIEDALQEYVPPNNSKSSLAGHDMAATLFAEILGDKVYRPAEDKKCNSLNINAVSKQDILDAGKQVVIVGGCGEGNAWTQWVFNFDRKQKANDGFDAATCEADFFSAADYQSKFTRLWQDSTRLSSVAIQGLQAITAAELKSMTLCGLHQASLDQLIAGDDRLPAAIWSWDEHFPKISGKAQCTTQAANGRWRTSDCEEKKRFACKVGQVWTLSETSDTWATGRQTCEANGGSFSLPLTAKENAKLNVSKSAAKAGDVWLNWKDATGKGAFKVPAKKL